MRAKKAGMKQVKALMKEVRWGVLATTDGKKVGVRPMGGLTWFGDELWAASGARADKVAQLRKVPHAEYCFSRPDGTHVRIAGRCKVSTSPADKRRFYKAVPVLKQYFDDPASPAFVVIRMRPARVRLMAAPHMEYTEIKRT